VLSLYLLTFHASNNKINHIFLYSEPIILASYSCISFLVFGCPTYGTLCWICVIFFACVWGGASDLMITSDDPCWGGASDLTITSDDPYPLRSLWHVRQVLS
jgi:hypothetical protein